MFLSSLHLALTGTGMVGMAAGIPATAEAGGRHGTIGEAAVAAAGETVETGVAAAAAAEEGPDQILGTVLLGGTGGSTFVKAFF